MDYWDLMWNRIIEDPLIKDEYRKAFLLNIFQKLCSKMNKDNDFKKHIKKLYQESFDNKDTTRIIVEKEFKIRLSENDIDLMNKWIKASLKKSSTRKTIPHAVKEELYKKQNGLCVACGQPLGNDWKEIHVDHIIPWVLVGDELENNYQDLCETCNKCKSSKTDYIFKNLINLN